MDICGKEIKCRGTLIRTVHLDGEGYQFLEDPEAVVRAVRDSKTRADLFTFIQRLSDTTPKYHFPMEWDNIATLHISTFEEWMKKKIDFKVRNKIRKAEKNGVIVREVPFDGALIRGIQAIYNESPIRQGKRFWHYGKDFDEIRKMKSTFLDRAIFIGAFFHENLIGFIKLVTDESRTQAGLMHIISMFQHRDKAPTNALMAQAVRSCAERGIPHIWYANFLYGKKQEDTLASFKRHNGFEKVDIPRYYVPITALGRMALRMGLHRNMIDWIPEPLTAVYRRFRAHWYARKFPGYENA